MKAVLLFLALAAAPAMAQSHDHHDMQDMPGMAAPEQAAPVAPTQAPDRSRDWAAEHVYDAARMAASRKALFAEHGGTPFAQLMVNIAEIDPRGNHTAYRWDAEGWYGGDIDRLALKSEGEGTFGRAVEHAEVQTLWSHALDPYWNLQAGGRYDIRPTPRRGYAAVGIEGLAPYWFEVEGAVFLSNKGDLLGRIEAYYDQRLTQRLVLQPRIEANLSAQDVHETRLGSGLTDIELGLRLRYEIRRAFAPYVGLSYDRAFGGTARLIRAAGDSPHSGKLVTGIRFWL